MLGPALTDLLSRLTGIPKGDRTEYQRGLFEELTWLLAAFPEEAPSPALADRKIALAAVPEIRSFLEAELVKTFRSSPAVAAFRSSKVWGSMTYTYQYDPTAGPGPSDPTPEDQKCSRCGQYFPVFTQRN